MDVIEPFLYVMGMGGFICAVTWLIGRKWIQKFRFARAVFCLLIAATVTPTAINILGWSIFPAIAIAPMTFCGDTNWIYGFLYGTVPICAVAGGSYGVWQFILKRDYVA